MQLPAPTGITVRYQGTAGLGTNQFWYWIQAIYPDGNSTLSSFGTTGAKCPASFDRNDFVSIQWNAMPGAIGYIVWKTSTSSPPTSGSILAFIATSETGLKDDGYTFVLQAGQPRFDGLYVWRAIYNFAVDGGAVGLITPSISDTIPVGAIMIGATINSPVAVTSGGSATVSVGVGASAAALLAATGKASFTTDALINGVPVIGTPVKITTAGQINLTVAVAALTAGVIEVFVFGYVATNA